MENIELLNQVANFYEHSWNKLIWVVASAFAFVGIVMPILLQFIQNRNFNLQVKALEGEISLKVKTEMESYIGKELNSLRDEVNSGVFFVQGLLFHSQKRIPDAISSYLISIRYAVECDKIKQANSAIDNINMIIKLINLEGYRDVIEPDIGNPLEYIEKLYKKDKSGAIEITSKEIYLKFKELDQEFKATPKESNHKE